MVSHQLGAQDHIRYCDTNRVDPAFRQKSVGYTLIQELQEGTCGGMWIPDVLPVLCFHRGFRLWKGDRAHSGDTGVKDNPAAGGHRIL